MYRKPAEQTPFDPPRRVLNLAMLACAGTMAVAPSAWAQSPETALSAIAPQTLPRITVTGSNIPRVDTETATPTQVIQREEIQRTGVTSIKELIDSLTGSSQIANGPNRSLSDIGGGGAFAAGASSASLRHLGPQSTLILLNSRRLPVFALDDDPGLFVNLDSLPLEAVDRVEVLRSGASAIYGSDAVAGVINIITRRQHRGLQARVSRQQSTNASEFNVSTASLTAGWGDLIEDRFNLLMNAEVYKRSAVMWREVIDHVNPQATRYSPSFGTDSTYSYPGNIIGAGPVAGCPAAKIRNGLCYYDRYARLQAQPAAERASLLLSGELQIDATLKGFAEALYSSTETRYILSDPSYGGNSATWFDPSTGQSRFYQDRGLPSGHPLNTTGVNNAEFRYRFADADSHDTVTSTSYRLLTGLRGTHDGTDWESAVGAMGSAVDNRGRGYFSDRGFRQTIGDHDAASDPQFFNRGYRIGQPNSAEVLNALFPEYASRGRMQQVFIDAKASRQIGKWRGHPVEVATGFDLRHETLRITPSSNLAAGDIVGYGVDETDGARTFGSVFSELSLHLTQKLEMQTAARIDKYPGFGPHLSPKVGLRFEATPQLLIRSTLEAGFRAPTLVESSRSTRYAFDGGIADPLRCPQAQALASALYAQAEALPTGAPSRTPLLARADSILQRECGRSVATVHKNNPDLRPETSTAATLGLVFQPARDHLASVDYWSIHRRNEIGYRSAQDLVNAEGSLPADVVNRLPEGSASESFTAAERRQYGVTVAPLGSVVSSVENTAQTLTSGVDVGLQSRMPSRLGIFNVNIQASYLLNYQTVSPLLGGYGDNLAGRYNHPRWRGAFSVAWARSGMTHALRLNLTSGTKLQGDFYDVVYSDSGCLANGWTVGDCRVRSASTFDYFFSYRFERGPTLSVNVLNLFNQRPPVDLRAINETGGGIVPQDLRDVQLRVLRLALEYKFF